jgi:hypothetical protein
MGVLSDDDIDTLLANNIGVSGKWSPISDVTDALGVLEFFGDGAILRRIDSEWCCYLPPKCDGQVSASFWDKSICRAVCFAALKVFGVN